MNRDLCSHVALQDNSVPSVPAKDVLTEMFRWLREGQSRRSYAAQEPSSSSVRPSQAASGVHRCSSTVQMLDEPARPGCPQSLLENPAQLTEHAQAQHCGLFWCCNRSSLTLKAPLMKIGLQVQYTCPRCQHLNLEYFVRQFFRAKWDPILANRLTAPHLVLSSLEEQVHLLWARWAPKKAPSRLSLPLLPDTRILLIRWLRITWVMALAWPFPALHLLKVLWVAVYILVSRFPVRE